MSKAIQVMPEKRPKVLDGHLKIGPARPIGKSNKMICWAAKKFPNVKTAHDAYSPIKIRLQTKDTAASKQKAADECAFARAVCREMDADGAYIGMVESCVIVDDKVIRFQTPESVRREIVSFDRHRDFRAGEYQLSAVCPKRRLGNRRKVKAPGTGLKAGEKTRVVPPVFHKTVSIRKPVTLADIK
jgi:hypothetical protein